MFRLNLNQISLVLTVLLFGLGYVIAYGIYYLSGEVDRVEQGWIAYQAEYSEEVRLKSALDRTLGYGGLIHKYKNLILRKDLQEVDRVNAHIGAVDLLLDQYAILSLKQGDHAAIDDIRRTMDQYRRALTKIENEIKRGANAHEIDGLVRIDDSYALRALKQLTKENIRHRQSILPGLSKAQQLSDLQAHLGYGGLIHSFKNYLLRYEEKYADEVMRSVNNAVAAIQTYKESGITDSEAVALTDIESTIGEYQSHILDIDQLIREGKSIEGIDTMVRVDDSRALRGLKLLASETYIQIREQEETLSHLLKQIQGMQKNMLVALVCIVAIIIFLCVWLIARHVRQPFKQVINTMNSLSQGNTNVEIASVEANNELGEMGRAIRVFRDEMISREQADLELQRVNDDLNNKVAELVESKKQKEENMAKAITLSEGLANARDEALLATRLAVAEKERAKAIVDTVSDGIITINEEGEIISFNLAAERIFGYSVEELSQRNISVLMPDSIRNKHDGFILKYLETGKGGVIGNKARMAKRRELLAVKKDGSEIVIELSIGVSSIEGRKMFTGVLRDITDRKKLENLKQEFVSTVSHELRTPLTAIKGSLGLLSSGMLGQAQDDQVKGLIDLTQRNVDRLGSLVDDILDFEKLESGQMKMEFRSVAVDEILKDAIEVNCHYGSDKKITYSIDSTVDADIIADTKRISQVMANLLSNAAKFSAAGSCVVVGAARREGKIRIYVKDQGPGIPEEFREHLFDRFTQADSSDIRHHGGTGLGMAISKSIVEKHQGKISFDTELSVGTTFYIDLPEHQRSGDTKVVNINKNSAMLEKV